MSLHATSVFRRLIRLRQLCLHPVLTGAKFVDDSATDELDERDDAALAQAALGPLAQLLDEGGAADTQHDKKESVKRAATVSTVQKRSVRLSICLYHHR